MENEKLIRKLWDNVYKPIRGGRPCPANHVAITAALKEALLEMREYRFSYPELYRKATLEYKKLCLEQEDRDFIELEVYKYQMKHFKL